MHFACVSNTDIFDQVASLKFPIDNGVCYCLREIYDTTEEVYLYFCIKLIHLVYSRTPSKRKNYTKIRNVKLWNQVHIIQVRASEVIILCAVLKNITWLFKECSNTT